jgi:NADPH:quinone reductase-like Zn-dependent oxidoreductase
MIPMKAAVYTRHNSAKVVEIIETAEPVPGGREVLIKVRAASVNPLDWRMKARRPGVDVAGEVVARGGGATRFKPGDAVFGLATGSFAEYACAREARLAAKPDNVTFEQAASVPIAGLTALQGLRNVGKLQAGQKLLINGAAGGIGTFAVQTAKVLGAEITGVCSTRNVEMVLGLGAGLAIDYTQQDFTRDGRHYDVILDNAANRSLADLRRAMTDHGRCVLAGAPKQAGAILARVVTAMVWSCFLRQSFIFFIALPKTEDLAMLSDWMRTGQITPIVDRQYSLSDAAQALAYVEQGHARAKVVINIS